VRRDTFGAALDPLVNGSTGDLINGTIARDMNEINSLIENRFQDICQNITKLTHLTIPKIRNSQIEQADIFSL
jgi:hypothetical protein